MKLDMNITDKNTRPVVVSRPKIKITPKPKKKKRWVLFLVLGIVIVILGGLGFVVFKGIQLSQKIGLNLGGSSISLTNKEPELNRDSTGKYTNFLILGLDATGGNTDTVMIASYNYDENRMVMLSIPRDLYVEVPCGYDGSITKSSKEYFKINSVYICAGGDTAGFQALEQTVKNVTGIEIQYYAMVNFNGLIDIINSVGGIDINVPEGFTDSTYPADPGKGTTFDGGDGIGLGYWMTVTFKAGIQHMDGKTALEYARSRHGTYTDTGNAVLDYGRAAHQQQVILALKDKILSTSTLTSPKAIMGIISSVSDNLKISPFTINDIEAALNLVKKFNNSGNSYSFVLTPDAANKNISVSSALGSSHQEPKLGLGKYSDIQTYVQDILTTPALYNENAMIYVYDDGLGYQATYKKVLALQDQYPFLNIIFGGSTKYDEQGDYIYTDDTDKTFKATIDEFANTLSITNKTKPNFVTTNLYGDVTILLGSEVQTTQQ
jgi:LCP family protein required for cell wall assembly